MFKIQTKTYAVIIMVLVIFNISYAADNEIEIENITPSFQNDSLYITAQFSNLFSNKNLSTLQSGLQSLIKIDLELLEHGGNENLISGTSTLAEIEIGMSLMYNIWDEVYYITDQNNKRSFSSIDDFIKNASTLQNLPLLNQSLLKSNARYSVRIMIQFFPISEQQKDKVEAWLRNPNKTKYTLASDERANRFQLTSGKMVSLFLGGKSRPKNSSKWYSSDVFNITQLTGQN